ncbi:hypothetical protein FDECE_7910 [Fusarium decemcellulare]|nr:hypothetical protein FDECE_7910 [Fusarium decemcellulare]
MSAGAGAAALGVDGAALGAEAGALATAIADGATAVAAGASEAASAATEAITGGGISFGRWAATEAAKQGVFLAGLKGVEALFHAEAGSSTDPGLAALAAKVQKTAEAVAALHTTTSSWIQWSTAHYDKRDSYGSVDVTGISVTRFAILQASVGSLTGMLNSTVAPALEDFNKSKSAGDLDNLRSKLLAYGQKVKGQSDTIANNDQAMVADGLQPHQADVAKALAALS